MCYFGGILHTARMITHLLGLSKITGMDCIVIFYANVCCVITTLLDIQLGNPVLWFDQVCIKTIGFIKHLDFIHWLADL
jgi:hypothetical protein